MASAIFSGALSVIAAIADPLPLRNAPSARAPSAATITRGRKGISFARNGWLKLTDRLFRIVSESRDANAAVSAHAFAQFCTAATREICEGKILRARAVSISSSGTRRTKYNRDATLKR